MPTRRRLRFSKAPSPTQAREGRERGGEESALRLQKGPCWNGVVENTNAGTGLAGWARAGGRRPGSQAGSQPARQAGRQAASQPASEPSRAQPIRAQPSRAQPSRAEPSPAPLLATRTCLIGAAAGCAGCWSPSTTGGPTNTSPGAGCCTKTTTCASRFYFRPQVVGHVI